MDKKRIKILTSGVIPVKGFFCGPILTPHFETISNIYQLISAGVNVVEVLDNGSEIRLTMMNYNIDNNPHAYVNKKPVGTTPVVFIDPDPVPVQVDEIEPPVTEEPEIDEQVKEDETHVTKEPEVEETEEPEVTEQIEKDETPIVEPVVIEEPPHPVTEEPEIVEQIEEQVKMEDTTEETLNKDTVIKTDVKVGTLNNEKREGNNNKKNKNRK